MVTAPLSSHSKSHFSRHLTRAELLTSKPITSLLRSLASTRVVPPPTNWSSIRSPSFEYLRIILRGIYGDQFPLYLASWVAQLPLWGKLHTVFISSSKSSGSHFFIFLSLIFILVSSSKFHFPSRL